MKTLKELIEAATPGPWRARRRGEDDPGYVHADEPGKPYGTEVLGDDYHAHRSRLADVDFIARCNPATMLLVLEALELAEIVKSVVVLNSSGNIGAARDLCANSGFSGEYDMMQTASQKYSAALSALNNPTP